MTSFDKEHVTPYFYSNHQNFKIVNFKENSSYYKNLPKLSVDYKSDVKKFLNISKMIKAGIIGTGVGMKHFEAISGHRKSKVTCILEKDKKQNIKNKKVQKFKDI